jgi:copper homeostasis protein
MTKTNETLTEVAVFTPKSALIAASNGAHRIELCSGYSEGGLSPSAATILYVREKVKIPIYVMIRPRVGDFVYDEPEKEIILRDVEFCRQAGADGVVFGALTPDGEVDKDFTRKVVGSAAPLSVTFHRAFDLCNDLEKALEDLIECGIHRVLTSGGKQTAVEAIPEIARLVKLSRGRIIILPGGGIGPGNIREFISKTGVQEIHFSAKKLVKGNARVHENLSLTDDGKVNDYYRYECDPEIISMIREVIYESK